MAYDSTLWKSGDVITAEKLNKIESQVAPLIGVLWRDIESNLMNLSLSYKDIRDAVLSGRNIVIYNIEYEEQNNYEEIFPGYKIAMFSEENSNYYVQIYIDGGNTMMQANSETDPLIEEQANISS